MKNFKKGDKVVMHSSTEVAQPKSEDEIWTCTCNSYNSINGIEVVDVEGGISIFSCEITLFPCKDLQLVNTKTGTNDKQ